MNINQLIAIVKKKLEDGLKIEKLIIEDKTFLHKNHKGHQADKFHLKLTIKSDQLRKLTKIEGNKKIYKILDQEMKEFIHSLQILII
tara:strand:+ start:289 stop:549 length:261 start_codon:yes stop_codon:yes gene_type:complete